MFLKRIELQGFKSFADKTIITFDHEVVGIVGPNGCGKSNITDAIRWALGEQSIKSLRGDKMIDVIFNGSDTRKPVNMAEVTLVFDNTNHYLHIDYDEVEITRRLHRASGEGEYFINKTPCRLKDVKDLIMDTGLGRDSLSIISQGTVANFVESKPEERRALFEEAAGVSKYKKRKNESLGKLNRTQENLDRLEDILLELERQITPLKRQAKKAQEYLEKKKELETIEISVLVDEIELYTSKIDETKKQLFEYESTQAIQETTIAMNEAKNLEIRKEISDLDKDINALQEKFILVMNEIQALEASKTEIDEKRKYALETASNEERAKELKAMLDEVSYEYHDRLNRVSELRVNLDLKEEEMNKLNDTYAQLRNEHNQQANYLNRIKSQQMSLEGQLRQPFNHQQGVRTIMNAKDNFMGVLGVVSQVLHPQDGYEQAISSAVAGAMYHIVCEDEMSARHAITYLKKNQSGRATFLPLSVLKERYLPHDQEIIASNMIGYLGVASSFVNCEETYDLLNSSLLGNVLVADNLTNANELAKALKFKFKIVTLDGEVVNRDGSMTGGKTKESFSPMALQKELNEIKKMVEKQEMLVNELDNKLHALISKREVLSADIVQFQIDLATLTPVVDAKKAKMERIKAEYEECRPSDMKEDQEEMISAEPLVAQLSAAYKRRDSITSDIKSKRERRMKAANESERNESQIRQLRRDINSLMSEAKQIEMEQVKAETNLENALNRLSSTYEMTYDFAKTMRIDTDMIEARKKVYVLRQEIAQLGNINLEAPTQYEEVSARYEFMTKQREDLISAKNKILEAIDEMDEIMAKQFKETFDAIDAQLNNEFRKLFGGGKASLKLVDPNDILNTGIDIDVQPPGKNITNLTLLSGGEKSLVAICVLFSILRACTMPLCIFDEVEAALDTANVERFAKYISQFRDGSQFIVVTHRPGTMEQCDTLYGVTMKHRGVSSMLRVQLNEAMNYASQEGAK